MEHEPKQHRRGVGLALLFLTIAYIVAMSAYFLTEHADALFMAQGRSLWLSDTDFLRECMSRPAGLLAYCALWINQFFFHVNVGIAWLTAIWVALSLVLIRVGRVPMALSPLAVAPVVCLLGFNVSLGYWMYEVRYAAIYVMPSLGLLCAVLLAWLARVDRWAVTAVVAGVVAYPLVGVFASVALLMVAVMCLTTYGRRGVVSAVVALLMAVASPMAWCRAYDTVNGDDAFIMGLPSFSQQGAVNSEMMTPLYCALASVVIMMLLCRVPAKAVARRWAVALIAVVVMAGGVVGVNRLNYNNKVFLTECKVYHDIEEQRWDEALMSISGAGDTISRQLIVMKNIALFNTGRLGDIMYDFDDVGFTPTMNDSLRVSMIITAAPLIYFNHGMMNFARRWCIEETVERGMNVDALKVLTRTALVTGELAVARKYIEILRRTLFHRDWAERYEPLSRSAARVAKSGELATVRELYRALPNVVATDNGLCEKFILDTYSHLRPTTSRKQAELSLAYAMMSKNIQRFWPRYLQYRSMLAGQPMPKNYQEAAFLYGMLEPQTAPNPQQFGLTFDMETIVGRYKTFQQTADQMFQTGMDEKAVGRALINDYGNTFWWTYFFVRDSKYY